MSISFTVLLGIILGAFLEKLKPHAIARNLNRDVDEKPVVEIDASNQTWCPR